MSTNATADMLLGGRIRIERAIGEGAMGVVYQAFDTKLRRPVAVKVIAPDLVDNERARQRFDREARSAAKLTNEHSVRILDVGADAAEPYLVMEYLEGRSLESIVLANGRVAPLQAVDWILQALEALAEAHQRGLVHRDIKPGNLFLAQRHGRDPFVKVLDFGLVKDLDPTKPRLTKTGVAMGTPAYMSPEQVRAVPDIDARADIWGIGASLYELLTGNLPFTAKTMPDLLMAIVHGETAPLREGRPDIPAAIEPVIRRCLAKERCDRYPTAAEVRSALVEAVGGTGETVRVDSRPRGGATSRMPIANGAPSQGTVPLSSPGVAPTEPIARALSSSPPAPAYAPAPAPASAFGAPGFVPPPAGFAPRWQVAPPDSAGVRRSRSPRARPQSSALVFVLALLAVVVLGGLALLALIFLAPHLT